MRPAQRLRRRRDFSAVYRRGRTYRGQLLTLRALPNACSESRFGFTVAKVLGNAVTRNRLKRRLREAARSLAVAPGYDIVVNTRPGAPVAGFSALRQAMSDLMARAGLLKESSP